MNFGRNHRNSPTYQIRLSGRCFPVGRQGMELPEEHECNKKDDREWESVRTESASKKGDWVKATFFVD